MSTRLASVSRARPSHPFSSRSPRRRGITSLLAMLYLVVFAALALGFYAQTNISAQLANNEIQSSKALFAAESGMAFMRQQLIKVETPHAPEDQVLVELAYELVRLMNDTGNLTSHGYQEVGMSATGDAILVPGDENATIRLGDGTGFRCKITRSGGRFVVKVVGKTAGAAVGTGRGVEYAFEGKQHSAPIFGYGIASRGSIELLGNATIKGVPASRGSILSTSNTAIALKMDSNASVSGDVYFEDGATGYSLTSNATIAGEKEPGQVAKHVHNGIAPPEFPAIDTSAFEPYATTILSIPNMKYDVGLLRNIRIKAGTNPIFDSGLIIEGVVYIEQPNQVTFNSNVQIKGVIMVDNKTVGTSATNWINFHSNVKVTGMPGLPPPTLIPELDPFPAGLRALTGSTILAPNFNLYFNSNFGLAGGSVAAASMTFDSNAVGTISGSLISLEDKPLRMTGNSAVTIETQPNNTWPAGMHFKSFYAPLRKTYREFHPSAEGM